TGLSLKYSRDRKALMQVLTRFYSTSKSESNNEKIEKPSTEPRDSESPGVHINESTEQEEKVIRRHNAITPEEHERELRSHQWQEEEYDRNEERRSSNRHTHKYDYTFNFSSEDQASEIIKVARAHYTRRRTMWVTLI